MGCSILRRPVGRPIRADGREPPSAGASSGQDRPFDGARFDLDQISIPAAVDRIAVEVASDPMGASGATVRVLRWIKTGFVASR